VNGSCREGRYGIEDYVWEVDRCALGIVGGMVQIEDVFGRGLHGVSCEWE